MHKQRFSCECRQTLLAVLTAVETVGMIAAQDAINAALQVLAQAVNTAAGFAIL
jgi:hypothetical protein